MGLYQIEKILPSKETSRKVKRQGTEQKHYQLFLHGRLISRVYKERNNINIDKI